MLLISHELPEVKATPDLDSILCNGAISEPESDSEDDHGIVIINNAELTNIELIKDADWSEKSLFELTPEFNVKVDSDDILFKFGCNKLDWEEDAKKLAWRKSDLYDDR